jgi:hypothetical protein
MRNIDFKLHAQFWSGPLDGWICCPDERDIRESGRRLVHCTAIVLGGIDVNVVGSVGPVARYLWDGNEPDFGKPFRYVFDGYESV